MMGTGAISRSNGVVQNVTKTRIPNGVSQNADSKALAGLFKLMMNFFIAGLIGLVGGVTAGFLFMLISIRILGRKRR